MIGAVVQAQDQRRPDFTSRVELVTTDVVVRDNSGQFIADLKKDDFEVIEDGVPQKVVSFSLTHGGRSYNIAAPPPAPVAEGILLPPSRPASDAAGRIFLIFVDDLHLDFRNTGRIRDLFKKISDELVHEGDMFGIVSTGPSSHLHRPDLRPAPSDRGDQEDLRRRARAERHPRRAAGIAGAAGSAPPRARRVLDRVGHDAAARTGPQPPQGVHLREQRLRPRSVREDPGEERGRALRQSAQQRRQQRRRVEQSQDPNDPALRGQGNQFAFADLVSELAELTRAAIRANTTIYTIDPRGLVGGPDLDEKIDMMEYLDYVRNSQDSLRVLADLTGGIAVVNQNDFTKALKRIDQETSDYYVVGYYSTNPDPTKKRRTIEVKVTRPGANVWHRTSYTLKPPPSQTR